MIYWRCWYHLVWNTKNSAPLIDSESALVIHNVLSLHAEKSGGTLVASGNVTDHMHIIAEIPPTVSPLEFLRALQAESAFAVRASFRHQADFEWGDDYGMISLSEKRLSEAARYVKNQQALHASGELWEEFERWEE